MKSTIDKKSSQFFCITYLITDKCTKCKLVCIEYALVLQIVLNAKIIWQASNEAKYELFSWLQDLIQKLLVK